MNRLPEAMGRAAQLPQAAVIGFIIASQLVMEGAGPLDQEYTGKFEPQHVVNRDNLEQVVFKPMRELAKIQIAKPPDGDSTVTVGRLYHAPSDKSAILALLVEARSGARYLLA